MNQIQLAQGCLLGAFIGDAAGARLEFLGRQPSEPEIADAMAMKGGGVLHVAPGQITDDGELTLALAHALVGESQFPREKVAASYRAWAASHPFDMGNATHAALSGPIAPQEKAADVVASRAALHNMESKANGALMRASALGIWSSRLTEKEAAEAARQDASLTHPNPSCQWANAAYVVAIRSLLLSSGDGSGAFERARAVVELATGDAASEVMSWLEDAEEGNLPAGYPTAGFVRIAFTHAFHHTLRGTPFIEALHQTLALGGDTDTNACIVGGLVGARRGVQGIPEHMASSVLGCDTTIGRPRPEWLSTRGAAALASKLLS